MLSKIKKSKYLTSFIQGGIVAIIISIICVGNLFSGWQRKITDQLYIGYEPSQHIVIISIDNKSIQKIGRWPWDRSVQAQIIEKLSEYGAKVIGYDIALPEPQSTIEDAAFTSALSEKNNTILPLEATLFTDKGNILISKSSLYPIDDFTKEAFSVGMVNTPTDQDGIVRRIPVLIKDTKGDYYEAFFLKVARKFLDLENQNDPENISEGFYKFNNQKIPIDKLSRTIINYSGKPGNYKTFSFSDVLDGKISPKEFKNKIVFVGATAPDLHDDQLVPISKGKSMSGVEVHANATQTLLNKKFLSEQNKSEALLWIILTAFLCSLLFSRLKLTISSLIAAVFVFGYLILAFILFDSGYIIKILYLLLTILLSFFISLIYKYFYADKQKRFIKKIFQHYVAKDIVKEMLSNPEKIKLGGQKKEMVIFFSDIRGFTSISEKIGTEKLVHLLNEYLDVMTNIVIGKQGVVDKFIGDAIMAFWNAPLTIKNPEKHAIDAAIEMFKELKSMNKVWEKKNYPPVDIGVGINTGEAIAGNIGSEKRFDYTIIGDNVNIASRLEGLNKFYKTHILITETTYQRIKNDYKTRYADLVIVKGKKEPLAIYEVLIDEFPTDWTNQYHKAIQLYKDQKFKKALEIFKELLENNKADHLTEIYIERCENFIKNPPGNNWDGVYEFKTK